MNETEVNRHALLQIPIGTLPEDQEVPERTYRNRVPGSNFIDRVGQVHTWNHDGELTTKSKNLQMELDKINNKPGSPVYTDAKAVELDSDRRPINEIQTRAAEVIDQLNKVRAAQVQ